MCAASAGQWPNTAWDQQLIQPDSQLRQTSSVHGKSMVQKATKFRFHSSAPVDLLCVAAAQGVQESCQQTSTELHSA